MFQISNILLHFLVLHILISEYQAKNKSNIITKTYIKAYNMECNLSPEYVENLKCKLQAKSWTRSTMNFRADLKIPLRNISINAALYKMYSEFRPYLVNFSINACDFLKGKTSKYAVKMTYRYLQQYSNINHSCPFEGTIFAEGMEMKDSYIPVGFLVPLGKFKTALIFTDGYPPKDIGSINVYGESFEKRIRRDG